MKTALLASVHGEVKDHTGFVMFLNSHRDNAYHVGLVLFVGGKLSRDMEELAMEASHDTVLVESRLLADAPKTGNKDRHIEFAHWLFDNGWKYDAVMTVDARDTIVQGDPFGWRTGSVAGCVCVSLEAAMTNQCEWNSADREAMATRLRDNCKPAGPAPIVNGGFVCGPTTDMAWFSFARACFDAHSGKGTDQASLTLITEQLSYHANFHVVPPVNPWVVHGHWMCRDKPFGEKFTLVDNRLVFNGGLLGGPALFHQWDRTSFGVKLLLEYGGGRNWPRD